ncbi:MAG TPA: chromate transporter [Firmicutes bacterium]|nr:chromate transporter [Bacillota bacterium]
MKILLILFFEFFKTGLFAVGGGLATLPFLYEIASKYDWFDESLLADMIAISESTPGPIGVNMATYAGFHAKGIIGGVVATLGLVFPSVIIVILVAKVLKKFKESELVKRIFYVLRPAVTGLIAVAGFAVLKISVFNVERFEETNQFADFFNWKALILFGVLFYLIEKYKKHPIVYLAGAALVGVIIGL